MGYFEAIDHEDLWAFVLMIRQKKAKGKKLEKYEREFYESNRELCRVDIQPEKTAEDALMDIFNELAEGGDDNG